MAGLSEEQVRDYEEYLDREIGRLRRLMKDSSTHRDSYASDEEKQQWRVFMDVRETFRSIRDRESNS